MIGFNPFNPPQADEIRAKINRLKKRYPGLSPWELAEKITQEKSLWCALVGAFSALPAVVPGIGTVIALFGGVAIDITLLTYLLASMVLEIAAVYGRDLTGPGYRKEAFWAFVLATGTGTVGNTLSRTLIAQVSKEAFTGMVERFLVSLGVRTTARSTVLRLIPLLGLFLAGGINYWVCKKVGGRAIRYYQTSLQNNEEGITVDVEYVLHPGNNKS